MAIQDFKPEHLAKLQEGIDQKHEFIGYCIEDGTSINLYDKDAKVAWYIAFNPLSKGAVNGWAIWMFTMTDEMDEETYHERNTVEWNMKEFGLSEDEVQPYLLMEDGVIDMQYIDNIVINIEVEQQEKIRTPFNLGEALIKLIQFGFTVRRDRTQPTKFDKGEMREYYLVERNGEKFQIMPKWDGDERWHIRGVNNFTTNGQWVGEAILMETFISELKPIYRNSNIDIKFMGYGN